MSIIMKSAVYSENDVSQIRREVRNDALEEAATVAAKMKPEVWALSIDTAVAIRKLKDEEK